MGSNSPSNLREAFEKVILIMFIRIKISLLLLLLVLAVSIIGCAKKDASIEALYLMPVGGMPPVMAVGESSVFETEELRVSLSQVKKPGEAGSNMIDGLLEDGYIIFWMEIRNNSGERVIYNPSLTALRDSRNGYRKPLDYTSLYRIASRLGKESVRSLKAEVGGRFYDSNERLSSGGSVTKLLIFRPLPGGAKKARVVIKELYVGTSTMRVDFPFVFRELAE